MRNDARPEGERAQRDLDPAHQEQAIERSPGGSTRPGPSVVDEHAASSNTQHAGGLTGGSPEGPPKETPERRDERGKAASSGSDPALPADDSTLWTDI